MAFKSIIYISCARLTVISFNAGVVIIGLINDLISAGHSFARITALKILVLVNRCYFLSGKTIFKWGGMNIRVAKCAGVHLASTVFLIACSNGGGSGDSDTVPNSLQSSLESLGVSTESSARLDSQGNEYPDAYAPMGQTIMVRQIDPSADDASSEPEYLVGRAEELFFGGFRLKTRSFMFSSLDDVSIVGLTESEARFIVPEVLEGRLDNEVPWAAEFDFYPARELPVTRRDAVAADTDGDDFSEVVTVFMDDSSGSQEIWMQIIDGQSATPIFEAGLLAGGGYLPMGDLQVAAADVDGDGRDEIVVAISRERQDGVLTTPVGIYIIDDADNGYVVMDEYDVTYTAYLPGSYIALEIDGFHADHDGKDEFVLIINEGLAFQEPGTFATRFKVFEAPNGVVAEIHSGPIEGTVPDSDGFPITATAVTANVTTDDLDGDGLDELIFAGFDKIVESCKELAPASGEVEGAHYFIATFGGRFNDFAPMATGVDEIFPTTCNFEGIGSFIMRYANVNILDFDGDGDADIQVNNMVLDAIPEGSWSDTMIAFLSDSKLIYGSDAEDRGYYDRAESAFVISDQTGDGIDDIIAIYLDWNTSDPFVKVYSYDDAAQDKYRIATRFEIEPDDGQYKNPIMLTMDVDNDKVAQLRYTGDYFFDLTEPLPLAALAAAPCKRDIGQDGCSSSWGSTQSGALGKDFSVKVFGSAGAGMGAAGAGALGKWLVKVSGSAALKTSASYELSKSQTFSTGPFEDGVIFTAIPVDRFFYQIIRDNTDRGGTIGERLEIRLPRTPFVRIVEREYYNASIADDSEPVDDRIFKHTPGDISSYPDAAEKDTILARSLTQIENLRAEELDRIAFKLVPAERGLEVGPVYVGEGGGSTELALEYTESFGSANELAMGISFEAEMLAGAAISWEVGIEVGRTLSVSHGDSTLFAGSVDSISAELYAQHYYGFGLFTYLTTLGDQEIEVVNFWVEE